MMLTYLKNVAEKALGKPVADCVISVRLLAQKKKQKRNEVFTFEFFRFRLSLLMLSDEACWTPVPLQD